MQPIQAQKPEYFGMRSATPCGDKAELNSPVVIARAPANESSILRLPDGTLKIFYVNKPGTADKMMSISSKDGGYSWGNAKIEFKLPGTAYHANSVVLDENGNIHCVFHIFGKGKNGYHGRQLNLWYCHTLHNGKQWSNPKEIFDGYVGSVRGFIRLKDNRLLLAFAAAVPSLENKPIDSNVVDYGWNEIISLYSNDHGSSWHRSINRIKISVNSRNKTRYGAIEPSILQLSNGTVWMLIRTNKGFLYQSFSNDEGKTWTAAEPTEFVSSDSPASLVRISKNRILLFWCSDQRHDDPNSYANGGREVLHAAVSGDEGKSWKGFREVLVSSTSEHPVGDHGTAYPSAIENDRGNIVLVSGQGENGEIVMFDPAWLQKKEFSEYISDSLQHSTFFGMKERSITEAKEGRVLNFPMTKKGTLKLQIITKQPMEINIALSDHFSVSNDSLATIEAPVLFKWKCNNNSENLNLRIDWDSNKKSALLFCNGQLKQQKKFSRKAFWGLNYLRTKAVNSGKKVSYIIKSISLSPEL